MAISKIFLFALLLALSITVFAQTETELESINRANIQFFVDEVYNLGNTNVLEILFAEEAVGHPGEQSRSDFAVAVSNLRTALPDLYAEPTIVLVENDSVALQLLLRGTFINEMLFADDLTIGPTGEEIQFHTTLVLKTNAEGQVVEYWTALDTSRFLLQTDFIPQAEYVLQGDTSYFPVIQTGQDADNIAATMQYYDALQDRNLDMIDQQMSEDFVAYTPFGNFDRGSQLANLRLLRETFSDYSRESHVMLVDGNYVAVVQTIRGTITNNLILAEKITIPATNTSLDWLRIDFLRFDEPGLIAEMWELYDIRDVFEQLDIPLADD